MEKKPTSATVMGLMVALVMAVYSLLTYFTDLYMEPWAQICGGVLLFGGLMTCVLLHAKEVNYRDSFGALFGFGFKATASCAVISIAYSVLQSFVFPDIKTRFLESQREAALKSENAAANAQAIEDGIAMLDKNYIMFMILGMIFWLLIIGAIASLIGAAVAKKNRVDTNFENI